MESYQKVPRKDTRDSKNETGDSRRKKYLPSDTQLDLSKESDEGHQSLKPQVSGEK